MEKFFLRQSWKPLCLRLALVFGMAGVVHAAPVSLPLNAALNEQIVMIPVSPATGQGSGSAQLETTVFRPPGPGPFPLLVMNHGKSLGNPGRQARDRFLVLSREFVRLGYAVAIPMRSGFSRSSGPYRESPCDMTRNGKTQADDLFKAMTYLVTQSWVDKDRILVAGQSYGGLATMAFGARGFPGVRGLINFAGGLRVHGGTCQWQHSLVQAFADFGRHSRVPSLWFYGANDSHFDPVLANNMVNAYLAGGGSARLVAFGAFKKDAHLMSGSADGIKVWLPETEKFLRELGMPADPVVALADENRPPKSDFAELHNVDAVPYLKDQGREAYRAFLSRGLPRAFAIAPSGAWSWAEDGDDPVSQVLANCARSAAQPCHLYAVNDAVVWAPQPKVGSATLAATATATATATGGK